MFFKVILGFVLFFFVSCSKHNAQIYKDCSYGSDSPAPYTLDAIDKAYVCGQREQGNK